MGYQAPVDPSRVIKIECHDLPQQFEKGEGDYELRYAHKPKEVFFYDIITLHKELERLMPGRGEQILDTIQNFRRAFLNLDTGQVTS